MEAVKAVLVVLLVAGGARAHMRFVCPRPESGNSGIKEGICSSENNPFELRYTDITPGPLTLQFEETVVHAGAPVRLALNQYGSEESCFLLDQVPHNEAAIMDINDDCRPFDWPIGRCPAQHFVTVMIPDIECEYCYLQLVSVMTDKYTDEELPCWQESLTTNNCSTYYSCANVRIRPTKNGIGKGIDTCTNYNSNMRGVWPYRPQDLYKVEFDTGLEGSAQYDSYDHTLTVTMPSTMGDCRHKGSTSIKISHMAEGYLVASSEAAVEGDTITAVISVPAQHVETMATNQLQMELFDSRFEARLAGGPIKITDRLFAKNYYGRLGLNFTDAGWLQGPEFVGQKAVYPFALESHGTCVPLTRFYTGSTILSTGSSAGVIQVTVSENHGKVQGAFTGAGDLISVRLSHTQGAVSALEVPSSLITGSNVAAMLDFSQAAMAGTFYDQVTVTFANGEQNTFEIVESVSATLRGRDESYGGSAALSIEDNGRITVTAVVAGVTGVSSMAVHGPARRGLVGPVLKTLSTFPTQDGAYAIATFAGSVELIDALWTGEAYLDVRTPFSDPEDRDISGQLSIPGDHLCNDGSNKCFHTQLSLEGGEVDYSQPELSSNGRATFFFTPEGALQYRLRVQDIVAGETTSVAGLTGPFLFSYDLEATFTPSSIEDKVLLASGTIDEPSSELLQYLASGDLNINIYTSRTGIIPIYGPVPAMSMA